MHVGGFHGVRDAWGEEVNCQDSLVAGMSGCSKVHDRWRYLLQAIIILVTIVTIIHQLSPYATV